MRPAGRTLLPALALSACLAVVPVRAAQAAPPHVGARAGRPAQAATRPAKQAKSAGPCTVDVPVIGGSLSELTNGICEAAQGAAGAVGGVAGEAVGAAGNAVLDAVANWMIGAATQVTSFVAKEMQRSTTPQLRSAWFAAQFAPMADLGAALALLVTLVAFASAAIRRDPQALAGALVGIVRAGLGTGVVVALTALGLEIADQIGSAILSSSPHAFWATVAQAWGAKDFGGFGSSALATLIAVVETLGAILVWLELIARDAAIYLAVLFFPVVLAASIWPALNTWTGRLARLLLLFVVLKPVALIVLSLAGNAAAAGLSGASGVPGSVGTILAAVVIFALAALAPWALMYLLAADAESAYTAAGLRAATAGAVGGSGGGRSLRNAGGLRNAVSARRGGRGGDPPSGGSPGGGGSAPSGGGSPGGGSRRFPSSSSPSGRPSLGSASPAASAGDPGGTPSSERPPANAGETAGAGGGGTAAAGEREWAPPAAAEAVGTGSVGAAAGLSTGHSRARSLQPAAGGAPRGVPSPAPGDGSAGARAQERDSPPPRARPPHPARAHLRLVREGEEPPDRPDFTDPDSSGPEAA